MHDSFHIFFFTLCYFLFRQQGAWKSHYLTISLQSLQIFSWCTWSEPCELPVGSMLFFSESRFTGKTIGLFFCVWCLALSEPTAWYIINELWNAFAPFTVEGTYEHSQETNYFSSERFSFSHWRRHQCVEELLREVNCMTFLMWMAEFFFWMTAFLVQFH